MCMHCTVIHFTYYVSYTCRYYIPIIQQSSSINKQAHIMSETKKKKQRLDNGKDDDVVASFTSLSTDILANIFGHLPLKEIMRVRRVCKKTADAVKQTLVPFESFTFQFFKIDSVKMYNALVVMAEVLPGLQQICVDSASYHSRYEGGGGFRYADGEDPIESIAAGDDVTILNLDNVLSKFPNVSFAM